VLLSESHLQNGYRLACTTLITGYAEFSEKTISEKTYVNVELHNLNLSGSVGIAVDLGTTTIEMSVVNLSTGEAFPILKCFNPLKKFGMDVISRIAASMNAAVYQEMIDLLRSHVLKSIDMFLNNYSGVIEKNNKIVLEKIAFSGNSVMTYILLGYPLEKFRRHPFIIPEYHFEIKSSDIGFTKYKCEILIVPLVSAFLGGDFLGSLTLVKGNHFDNNDFKNNSLFIDMGTNAEIFFIQGENVFGASSPMGPAFEGMNILFGMAAQHGAILHCSLKDSKMIFVVSGNAEPIGIAGTGLIDIIACLLDIGVIQKNGYLQGSVEYPAESLSGERAVRLINNIYLTQKDIRNVQLAKGACMSAVKILLAESVCPANSVGCVYLGGSFGGNINIDNMKKLRFLPENISGDFIFAGNTSLRSAEKSIIDRSFIHECLFNRPLVQKIELSAHKDFNDVYIESLAF